MLYDVTRPASESGRVVVLLLMKRKETVKVVQFTA